MIQTLKEKYIAPKDFYIQTLKVTLPIALQNMLTGTMQIIDSIMVSWINMMTAVGTASQLDMLGGMINYGAIGGTAMFSAQFFGAKNYDKLKKSFGLSVMFGLGNGLLWLTIAILFGKDILGFYMDDVTTVNMAMKYLSVAMFSMPLNGLNFAFGSIYRCIQRQDVSLKVSVSAGLLNIFLNYVLIFGVWFFPELGVVGAAVATVIAHSFSITIYFIHAYITKQPFLGSAKEMFILDKQFITTIFKKTYPLIFNEAFFGFGMTMFIKAFGQLGTDSMEAYYVGNQINNMFQFVIYGYGAAVSVLLGSTLGQGKIEQARKDCDYFIGLSFFIALFMVTIMILFTKPMIALFDLQDPFIYQTAVWIVRVFSIRLSMRLFNFMIFSILRSGGDSKIITLLDCGIMWVIGIPLAFVSVNIFGIQNIAIVLLIVQAEQLIRMLIGLKRVGSGLWANNLNVSV